ncbi:hypothetical protein CDL15_Pgr024821 [Punica granatum]|uniref:Uncharacterized protein n=1 Tax=Punica granatum TaxID=22663 RepID=A0A218WJY1_PUNGR|nr:hypothetical protein CDL15_Pgr024821 [Punica granatum]
MRFGCEIELRVSGERSSWEIFGRVVELWVSAKDRAEGSSGARRAPGLGREVESRFFSFPWASSEKSGRS